MGKMLENMRAWWNDTAENLSDPGKLAQLSVADLEKSIRGAKEAAAPVVGRPTVLATKVKDLEETDQELTTKITALLKAGEEGKTAALKYIERQVAIRKELEMVTEEYNDAKEASTQWQDKIRTLETELYSRRHEADRLQAEFETAKAEQNIGKQLQSADSLMGSDQFDSYKAKVDKEKAKAAGYSAMSGLDDKVAEDRLLKSSESDALLAEYLSKNN